jgi:hypothetical protein
VSLWREVEIGSVPVTRARALKRFCDTESRDLIMTVSRQVCPFHADEDIQGAPTGGDEGSLSYTCTRTRGHPHEGPHTWLYVPQPDGLPGMEGYAAELDLATGLPAAITQYRGRWIEYGVAERAYALQYSDDFAAIVSRYGHTAVRPKQYSARRHARPVSTPPDHG